MNAHKVAEITGISVRTLHYYDAIDLLRPRRNPENGYREYSDADMDKLQQIMLFKECGFSLVQIKAFLNRSDFDREKAFELQQKYLLHEKKRINTMLKTLEKSIGHLKGELTLSQSDKFHGFDFTDNPYEAEARRLWGDDAVTQSHAHIGAMSEEAQQALSQGMDDLFKELALTVDEPPGSEVAQRAINKMYHYFNANLGFHYTLEAFAGLGQMYVDDERFTRNIDQYRAGLARFLAAAMKIYAANQPEK